MVSLTNTINQERIEAAGARPVLEHHSHWSDEAMLNLAFDAGFDSLQAITIVCIALAESSGHDDAQNWNPPTINCPSGSMDRGILQINDYWHWEVSDACAYNAPCSFRQAYRISYGGLEFGDWVTYQLRLHLAYAARVEAAYRRKIDDEWEIDP